MTEVIQAGHWAILVETQPGASHRRRGLENQDAAFGHISESETGTVISAAVADGHGSPKSFRSSVGSHKAVEVAREAIQSFVAQSGPEQSLSLVKDAATRTLPLTIVRRWREAVAADLETNPVILAEWERLEREAGSDVREKLERQMADGDSERLVIYGSTLLAALLTETFSLYLQLGDGEILILRDGEPKAVSPITESDPDLVANETTSLCSKDAQWRFRTEFSVRSGAAPPRLVLLTTDGYPNSFQSQDGFRQVASDLVAMFENEGAEAVGKNLPQWLEESSAQGSGDDMSVVLIYRIGQSSTSTVLTSREDVPTEPASPETAVAESIESAAPARSGLRKFVCDLLLPRNRSHE